MNSTRRPYTLDEDNLLLEWIIKSKLFYCLRGKNFWKDMTNANIFDNRSWQSLQNRFEKKILPDIKNPRYSLSDLDKSKIQLAWEQTAIDFDSNESDDNADNIDNDKISSSTHSSGSAHSSGDLNDAIVSSDENEHVSSTVGSHS